MKRALYFILILFLFNPVVSAQKMFESDIIKTFDSDLEITFIGHGSLMFKFNEKIIQVDPFSDVADYSKLPKADLVLITHEHFDHLDMKALSLTLKENTIVLMPEKCKSKATDIKNVEVVKNGDKKELFEVTIEAIPAYNLVHKRDNGEFFHPKGQGNGYVLTFNDKKVLVAGDTENIPEIKGLKDIDIAFLPMNLPYTMTPEMVADAAKTFKPKILYPYHYGKTDTNKLVELLKDDKSIDVRIRKM